MAANLNFTTEVCLDCGQKQFFIYRETIEKATKCSESDLVIKCLTTEFVGGTSLHNISHMRNLCPAVGNQGIKRPVRLWFLFVFSYALTPTNTFGASLTPVTWQYWGGSLAHDSTTPISLPYRENLNMLRKIPPFSALKGVIIHRGIVIYSWSWMCPAHYMHSARKLSTSTTAPSNLEKSTSSRRLIIKVQKVYLLTSANGLTSSSHYCRRARAQTSANVLCQQTNFLDHHVHCWRTNFWTSLDMTPKLVHRKASRESCVSVLRWGSFIEQSTYGLARWESDHLGSNGGNNQISVNKE